MTRFITIAASTAAIAALLLATPGMAQTKRGPDTPVDYSAHSAEELLAEMNRPDSAWLAKPCQIGVPLMTEVENRQPGDFYAQNRLLLARMNCAYENGDYQAAYELLHRLDARIGPEELEQTGISLALLLDDADATLERLGRMTRTRGGRPLLDLPEQNFDVALRLLAREERDNELAALALAMVGSESFALLPDERRGNLAYHALDAVVAQDRFDAVPVLLAELNVPATYPHLLASREYEAIWPQIETRVGDHFAGLSDEFLAYARAQYAAEPSDRDRFSDLAHALLYSGQFEEAAALGDDWRAQTDAMAGIEEGDAWALNVAAYAHDHLGNRAAADAILDDLARLDPAEHRWLVNFVINRALRLVGQGRWAEGLAANALADSVTAEQGSDFARMLVASNRVCALVGLDRAGEAEESLAFLRDNAADGLGVLTQALLCLGRSDEAAALLVEALGDEGRRDDAVRALQDSRFVMFGTHAILPDATDLLPQYPDLRTAFERHARTIPDRFVPRATLRREELAAR